jgi:hypothetical protein
LALLRNIFDHGVLVVMVTRFESAWGVHTVLMHEVLLPKIT